jgi:hypothetical protein
MTDDVRNADRNPMDYEEDRPIPSEQPPIEDIPPIDHAPVPPLTEPEDTEGG